MQGSVMKESMSVARTIAWNLISPRLRSKINKLSDSGVHVHCPDGATPKDGPSAGAAITTCLISLITDSRVNNEIAMTREINLKGDVTAIGGLEEKIHGAKTAGAKFVLCPYENLKDLKEIQEKHPMIFDKNFRVETVKNIWEVLELVLIDNKHKFLRF